MQVPNRQVTAHVVQRLAPGGIETIVLDLVRSAPSRTRIISLEGTTDELRAAWPELSTIDGQFEGLGRKPGLRPGLALQLGWRLRQLAPNAVFLHHIGPLIYGGLARHLAGMPVTFHVEHDVWHYDAPRRRTLLALMERAAPMPHVAVSNHAAETIRRLLPGASVAVIPNGVDLQRFRPQSRAVARARFGLDIDRTIVGTAGRLVPVKGHDILVTAAASLPEHIDVVVAGAGPERERLEALASELGISRRVRFLGHVDAIETLLPAFDVFCLPSRNEGMPRSLLEAQACGLPVVATDVGAVREVVCSETGRVVASGDSAVLADAILDVAGRRLSAAPRDFAADRFSWENTVRSYNRAAELGHAA